MRADMHEAESTPGLLAAGRSIDKACLSETMTTEQKAESCEKN
jgi:hypothetical protein